MGMRLLFNESRWYAAHDLKMNGYFLGKIGAGRDEWEYKCTNKYMYVE